MMITLTVARRHHHHPLQDNDISTEAAENKRLLKQWLLNNSQWHIFNQGHETDHQILRTDIRG